MANIRTRRGKSGKVSYQVTIRAKGNPTLVENFTNEAEAKAWRDAMRTAVASSVHAMPDTKTYKKTLVEDAISAYEKSGKASHTVLAYLTIANREIGKVSMGGLTTQCIEGLVKALLVRETRRGTPYKKASIAKIIGAIRSLVRYYAGECRVTPPLDEISTSVLGDDWDEERDRLLQTYEEELIRREFKNRKYDVQWDLMLDIALETAARQAEIVMAKLLEFDLNENVWIIPAKHTKANKSRQIPLSKRAVLAVARLKQLLEAENMRRRSLDPKAKLETRMFWQFKTPSSVCSRFRKIVSKLNLIDLRFHDLRHTAITRMVLFKRRLNPYDIMRISGHTTLKMLDRYANLRGGDLVERME